MKNVCAKIGSIAAVSGCALLPEAFIRLASEADEFLACPTPAKIGSLRMALYGADKLLQGAGEALTRADSEGDG